MDKAFVSFFVEGKPAPAGSKSYKGMRNGKPIIADSSGNAGVLWRKAVQAKAHAHWRRPVYAGAVWREFRFYVKRPKSHYGTGRNAGKLKPTAPADCLVQPDVIKMARAVEDALTEVIWKDDRQVIKGVESKHYADCNGGKVGVLVRVWLYPTIREVQSVRERNALVADGSA